MKQGGRRNGAFEVARLSFAHLGCPSRQVLRREVFARFVPALSVSCSTSGEPHLQHHPRSQGTHRIAKQAKASHLCARAKGAISMF